MSDSSIPLKAAGAEWCDTPIDTPLDRVALAACWGLATLEHYAEVGSTMERAREIASDRLVPLPAIVMADLQTAGRGRQGARWWQAPGSLAVSIVLDVPGVIAGVTSLTPAGPPPIWSLACGVALAEAETRAALRREADRRGILLSDEVMDYLLTHLQRDMGYLMDLLTRLDGYALAHQRLVTVPLLKRMLAEERPPALEVAE